MMFLLPTTTRGALMGIETGLAVQKRHLLDKRFQDGHSEYLYFSDSIADHFWEIVQRMPRSISESLEGAQKVVVEKVLKP